jgi:hypothetical protein
VACVTAAWRGALQVADLEPRLQLLKLLDDHVAVALGVVALEAEQAIGLSPRLSASSTSAAREPLLRCSR